ncbi:MAG: hypothetical protein D6694_11205 [Gammaproteobacteria bacterium]|nr:MAG: hypothetical protein D6694_11205 [Gammaproteobacteria bacterium]
MKKYVFYGLILANLVVALLYLNAPSQGSSGEVTLMLNQDWIRIVPPPSQTPVTDGAEGALPEGRRPSAETARSSKNATYNKQSENSEIPAFTCWLIDGLDDEVAARLEIELEKMGVEYRTIQNMRSQPAGHIVLIGPFASEAEGLKARRQAIKAGFGDALLLTRGRWKGSVSLGIFSSYDNAKRQQKRAKKRLPDLEIRIEQRFRNESKKAIYVRLDKGMSWPPKPIDSEHLNPNQKKWQKKTCKGVEFSETTQ